MARKQDWSIVPEPNTPNTCYTTDFRDSKYIMVYIDNLITVFINLSLPTLHLKSCNGIIKNNFLSLVLHEKRHMKKLFPYLEFYTETFHLQLLQYVKNMSSFESLSHFIT